MQCPRQCIITWSTVSNVGSLIIRERAFKRNSPADYVRGNFDFYPYKYERLDYSPHLHTVKEILALHKPAGEDSARNAMNGLFSMGAGNDMMQEMEEKMKIAKETRQAQMSELVHTMELPPVMNDT